MSVRQAVVRDLVVATTNAHKLQELQALLSGLGWRLQTQSAFAVEPAPEPFDSFVENALNKARNAARQCRLPVIADDSGLCVDAFDGQPGVRSARYAQLHQAGTGDAANNALLLQRLHDHTDRRARFVCVMVAMRSADDPMPLVALGTLTGEILRESIGTHGFGYDPLFRPKGEQRSLGQMSASEKNRISHRAKAATQMRQLLEHHW